MSLEARDLHLHCDAGVLIESLSLRIEPGTLTALVGPNGAGKSSLLRALAGDLRPTSGAVLMNGAPLADMRPWRQAQLRAVMEQTPPLAFDFSLAEVLRMGWIHGDAWGARAEVALATVASECRVQHLLERPFASLSGGEQQRGHFARALLQLWPDASIGGPRWLLLDEPTSSQDLGNELQLLRCARQAACRQVGVLVVLHDLNLAARFADRVALMHRARLRALGAPAAVLRAETLSDIYQTQMQTRWDETLERLLVLS